MSLVTNQIKLKPKLTTNVKPLVKEKPLIKIPKVREGLSLKSTATKTQEKIDQNVKNIKTRNT